MIETIVSRKCIVELRLSDDVYLLEIQPVDTDCIFVLPIKDFKSTDLLVKFMKYRKDKK